MNNVPEEKVQDERKEELDIETLKNMDYNNLICCGITPEDAERIINSEEKGRNR